eukprot:4922601-Pleurochrysis_carterae.AAC.1
MPQPRRCDLAALEPSALPLAPSPQMANPAARVATNPAAQAGNTAVQAGNYIYPAAQMADAAVQAGTYLAAHMADSGHMRPTTCTAVYSAANHLPGGAYSAAVKMEIKEPAQMAANHAAQMAYPPAQNVFAPAQNIYAPAQNFFPPTQNFFPPTQMAYPFHMALPSQVALVRAHRERSIRARIAYEELKKELLVDARVHYELDGRDLNGF